MQRVVSLGFIATLAIVIACGSERPPGVSETGASPAQAAGGASSRGADGSCAPSFTGLVRDFRGSDVSGGHPDFEAFRGNTATKGMVARALGPDMKPVFAATQGMLTGKAEFDQWYRDTPGVNMTFEFAPPFTTGADGVMTFATSEFFPIDARGFGNSATPKGGVPHNYSFTFELHLEFAYRGGEKFTFTGDDDLWTFINQRLAIDLGGLHPPQSETIDLDAAAATLGIEKGKTYALDVFHAERAKFGSNFRIDTTLAFTNCNPILPR